MQKYTGGETGIDLIFGLFKKQKKTNKNKAQWFDYVELGCEQILEVFYCSSISSTQYIS